MPTAREKTEALPRDSAHSADSPAPQASDGAPAPASHPCPVEPFCPIEERANALIHGVGLAASVAGAIALVVLILQARSSSLAWSWSLLGCLTYAASMIALYASSTCYHCARAAHRRAWLRVADHSCIYLLIAGTYTPFMLTLLRDVGWWGWGLLIAVWAMAAVGILFKLRYTGRFEVVSTLLYIAMGWLCVVAARPMLSTFPWPCLAWLFAGGVCYTAGTIFYLLDHRRWFHAIWHVMVVAGSACQWAAVARYAAIFPR